MQKTSFVLLLWACLSTLAWGQNFKEGSINYVIKAKGDGDLRVLDGSNFTAFFKGQKSKIKGDFMSGLVGVDMRLDGVKQSGLLLMDVMAKRMAMPLDDKGIKDLNIGASSGNTPKVTKTQSTKKIAGYTCKKVILNNPDGSKITAYVCDKIRPEGNDILTKLVGKDLGGLPLGMVMQKDGEELEIMATKVSEKAIEESHFNMAVPAGYKVTSPEELEKMLPK